VTRSGAGHLPAEDGAAVLREVLEGRLATRPSGARRALESVAVGEWPVLAGDAEIVFFVSNGSLDYISRMRFSDRREAGFTDWIAHEESNPLDLLDEDVRLALEQQLHGAG
jgi:hypothetical protein